jgi:hypothetical protein
MALMLSMACMGDVEATCAASMAVLLHAAWLSVQVSAAHVEAAVSVLRPAPII